MYIYIYIYIYTYVCMYVCMYVRMYVCMDACMYACMRTYAFTYVYILYICRRFLFNHRGVLEVTGPWPAGPEALLRRRIWPKLRAVLEARSGGSQGLLFWLFEGGYRWGFCKGI